MAVIHIVSQVTSINQEYEVRTLHWPYCWRYYGKDKWWTVKHQVSGIRRHPCLELLWQRQAGNTCRMHLPLIISLIHWEESRGHCDLCLQGLSLKALITTSCLELLSWALIGGYENIMTGWWWICFPQLEVLWVLHQVLTLLLMTQIMR